MLATAEAERPELTDAHAFVDHGARHAKRGRHLVDAHGQAQIAGRGHGEEAVMRSDAIRVPMRNRRDPTRGAHRRRSYLASSQQQRTGARLPA
jgi:hypothetical protein